MFQKKMGAEAVNFASQLTFTVGVLAVLLLSLFLGNSFQKSEQKLTETTKLSALNDCTIERLYKPSCEEFVEKALGKKPVVIRSVDTALLNSKTFTEISTKENLLREYSALPVKVSTANAHTGREWLESTLGDFLENWLMPQSVGNKRGNETFYLFGSQFGQDWAQFLEKYQTPLFPSENVRNHVSKDAFSESSQNEINKLFCKTSISVERTLSFGIGGRNTGVPFHFHGPGFLEMIHGKKQFLLYPPNEEIPNFDPNVTSFHWVMNSMRLLDEASKPFRCTLEPGDIIYFPDEWMHATLNLEDYNVFMATFA